VCVCVSLHVCALLVSAASAHAVCGPATCAHAACGLATCVHATCQDPHADELSVELDPRSVLELARDAGVLKQTSVTVGRMGMALRCGGSDAGTLCCCVRAWGSGGLCPARKHVSVLQGAGSGAWGAVCVCM